LKVQQLTRLGNRTKSRRMKYLSLWVQRDILHALEGMSLALFTRVLGWKLDRVTELLERVKKDICDMSIHAYSER
jgi:hypothetical protein